MCEIQSRRLTGGVLLALILFISGTAAGQDGGLEMALLGEFRLDSGETIQDLKVGYRTIGELNADRSNAILFPTWFTGTTEDLVPLVGPGKLLDPTGHFVILVDAIGDGVSTSASNSESQSRMQFPRFTIQDMVRSQHQLLTAELGIRHLKAVMGISMGGMQTFQWIVSYPDFMDKAIPIHGSPRLSSYDVLLWTAEIRAIQGDPAWKGGEYGSPPLEGMKTVAAINSLALTSPGYVFSNTSRSQLDAFLAETEEKIIQGFDANNWIRQAQAMIGLDVAAAFGGSMEAAAAAVRADVLVIVGSKDHMVGPQPALQFAHLLVAPVIILDSDCGHIAFTCEEEKVIPALARFLSR